MQRFVLEDHLGLAPISEARADYGHQQMYTRMYECIHARLFHLHAQITSNSNFYRHVYRILPPLLNRYTQDNNVHIWARGPAKPPCRLFNIYADMYKYQVLSINERTEAPKPDTKPPPPQNQQVEKNTGNVYPRPRQWCNPWGFRVC